MTELILELFLLIIVYLRSRFAISLEPLIRILLQKERFKRFDRKYPLRTIYLDFRSILLLPDRMTLLSILCIGGD